MPDKKYYMYVLLTADNTFYGGFTDNVLRRLAVHEAGKGAKYTRPKKRHPLHLIYSEEFETKGDALRAEAAFKKLTRLKKETFLLDHGVDWKKLNN
ncbi:GIY-YIG nuclease family protein [Weissella koreensis]|uniref:GIY-YIG nuclease family protein n=1 Tax=Weissella koreensis TaxID=165096 RepID=A0A7H1MN36_9LACO|nr:GIY-YIG nuclease family protein [Weissella koreensis]AVH75668.1 endonuclease [Weissella koreensis]QGN20891.1 GIY-YIG nuclease family protein [Weissella koreensis]QNT64872.1 GIY-YIG nuclease family protein [Weissella koreensis]